MYEADEGSISFNSSGSDTIDVRSLKKGELKKYREKVKYVFQDPARSLNPRMTIYDVLNSGKRWSSLRSKEKQSREDAAAILEEVGLNAEDLWRRPSEFSGGQRQRISIARALLMKPELLICDEVVSALDVSIQGQILNLLLDLRERRDLSFLFIAHDLKVACYFCDRIAVMYRGELMEEAAANELWNQGSLKTGVHPYTELLFSSVARSGSEPEKQGQAVESQKPVTQAEEGCCAFASRCPYAEEQCFREKPVLREPRQGHKLRCFKR
jgi:oligopeptide/dipeptide ABC transporter ATP-binding protein